MERNYSSKVRNSLDDIISFCISSYQGVGWGGVVWCGVGCSVVWGGVGRGVVWGGVGCGVELVACRVPHIA